LNLRDKKIGIKMKVLILGGTGMLGNAIFRTLSKESSYQVWATLRGSEWLPYFNKFEKKQLVNNVDVLDIRRLEEVLDKVQPDIIINCVGLIKQINKTNDPLIVLPINALFPHQLARLCLKIGSRLIHISTDCVFSGRKGMYREEDLSDAEDLYGKSKYIGELRDIVDTLTLRTSIIGHELNSHYSLVNWFLAQHDTVKGYEKAVFSGLPSVELARIIMNHIIPRPDLQGLFHVSSNPIDKYSLLSLIADIYHKDINIIKDDRLVIDRSLNSDKFKKATDYEPPSWPELVNNMYLKSKE
jgi:dTDP-4-dehydrorhamnose reductase